MLESNKTEIELGVRISGNQRKLAGEFGCGIGPVLPKNVGLAGEVMGFGQFRVGLQGAMQRGNGARVVPDFNPELPNEDQRLGGELSLLINGEDFARRFQVPQVRQGSSPGISDIGVLHARSAQR